MTTPALTERPTRGRVVVGPWTPRPGRAIDAAALNLLCRSATVVYYAADGERIADGEPLPLIEPLRPPADHGQWDAAVCRAGLKRFLRPALPDDGDYAGDAEGGHVLVVEPRDGERALRRASIAPHMLRRRSLRRLLDRPADAEELLALAVADADDESTSPEPISHERGS